MGKRAQTVVSFGWAALPLITAGIATAPAFLLPALRLRRPVHWLVLALYWALAITVFALLNAPDGSAADTVAIVSILALWLGGTVHALAIRSRVFATRPALPPPAVGRYELAVATATQRHELREAAREAARDPAVAWELRIGRPDLPRQFDDGGLVDVNHAPPPVLATLPGMTPELVNQIVETRARCDGFGSVEELSALAELPPSLTDRLGEYAIFL